MAEQKMTVNIPTAEHHLSRALPDRHRSSSSSRGSCRTAGRWRNWRRKPRMPSSGLKKQRALSPFQKSLQERSDEERIGDPAPPGERQAGAGQDQYTSDHFRRLGQDERDVPGVGNSQSQRPDRRRHGPVGKRRPQREISSTFGNFLSSSGVSPTCSRSKRSRIQQKTGHQGIQAEDLGGRRMNRQV